jgi:hypothetical protein
MVPNFRSRIVSVIGSVVLLLDSFQNGVMAQTNSTTGTYTVYSTFIFARTGERTPTLLDNENTVQLTAYGANQMYSMVRHLIRRNVPGESRLISRRDLSTGLDTLEQALKHLT